MSRKRSCAESHESNKKPRLIVRQHPSTEFKKYLKRCFYSKLLGNSGHETRNAVVPFFGQPGDKRTVVHLDASKCDSTIDRIFLKGIKLSNVVMPSLDMQRVIEMVQKDKYFYDMSLMDRELEREEIDAIQEEMKKWDVLSLHKIFQLCCFFEMGGFETILVNELMRQLLKLKERLDGIKNGFVSAELGDMEYLTTAIEMEQIKEILNHNQIAASVRLYDNEHYQQCAAVTEPEQLAYTQDTSVLFISAIHPVCTIYREVVEGSGSLYECVTEYARQVRMEPHVNPALKMLRLILLRRVLSRMHTIISLKTVISLKVPLFNYVNWNSGNVNKILEAKRNVTDYNMLKCFKAGYTMQQTATV